VPSAAAGLNSLADLWVARNPAANRRLARRWTPPFTAERNAQGRLVDYYPSLDTYIVHPAGSPPGMLQPDSFPTWWVLGCHAQQAQAQASAEREPNFISPGLLPRDSVIYIARSSADGPVTAWDWEPRNASQTRASLPFGPYEWHYEESSRRVYILVDGQRYNLLVNGRLAPQS
jgi:hypothetical protein